METAFTVTRPVLNQNKRQGLPILVRPEPQTSVKNYGQGLIRMRKEDYRLLLALIVFLTLLAVWVI